MKATGKDIMWAKHRAEKYLSDENKDRLILIAKENNNLVGYVGILEHDDNPARDFANLNDYSWISWIAVLPKYRKKGLGSFLLKIAEQYSRDFNKKGILLDCREKVLPFYTKNGYSVLGDYIDAGDSRYVMEKKLA